ncbi:MAG: response regulator transcription factor [Dehalococcoidia bacterium]|nr:response regulator transcription factor [Dehalococcoidia bacterium]
MSSKIRVLIADDHAIVREGLRAILEAQPDFEIAGEAVDGQEAVDKTIQLKPDIVIMDLTMPRLNGLEAMRQIKRNDPDARVLVLTMHENDTYFFQVLDAGASGYFIKGGSSAELISALRTVWHGDVFLYPSMAKKLLGDYLKRARMGSDKESYKGLTEREQEILKLIAEGRTNQEIADTLVLSTSTVQTHRAHIMAKLGLHTRTDLVKFAIHRGIITLDKYPPPEQPIP